MPCGDLAFHAKTDKTVVAFQPLFERSEHFKTLNLYSPKWNLISFVFLNQYHLLNGLF